MCVYSRITPHTYYLLSLKQKSFFPGYPYKSATFSFFRHVPLPLFLSPDIESEITGIHSSSYFLRLRFSLFRQYSCLSISFFLYIHIYIRIYVLCILYTCISMSFLFVFVVLNYSLKSDTYIWREKKQRWWRGGEVMVSGRRSKSVCVLWKRR